MQLRDALLMARADTSDALTVILALFRLQQDQLEQLEQRLFDHWHKVSSAKPEW